MQLNIDRGKDKSLELRQEIIDKDISVILLQEPYQYKGGIKGFGLKTRVITGDKEEPWAAVVVLDDQVGAMRVDNLSNSHCVVVELLLPRREKIYVVSMYCQFSEGMERYIYMIERIGNILKGERVIIGMDSNAHSSMWGGNYTDEKGTLLEGIIIDGRWNLINKVGEGPTYVDGRGRKTFIDLTITKGEITTNWEIKREWSLCNHKPILITIINNASIERKLRSKGNYRLSIRGADWGKYKEVLGKNMEKIGKQELNNKREILVRIKELTRIIMRSAREVLKGSGRRRATGNRWWDEELTRYKKEVYSARKMLKSEHEEDKKKVLLIDFRRKRRIYKRMIRIKEKNSWDNYVEEQMKDNTWGVPY